MTFPCIFACFKLLVLFPLPGYEYPGELVGEARGEPRELPARLDVGSDSQSYWCKRLRYPRSTTESLSPLNHVLSQMAKT